MFEPSQARRGPAPAGPFGVPGGVPAGVPVGAAAVQSWTSALLSVSRALDDGERIDLLRALEELTCAAAGAQVTVTADFDASQRAEQAAQGVPVARQGRGVASQVALARRESPFRGRQHLGMARSSRPRCPTH